MSLYEPHQATRDELEEYHSKEYLDFLEKVKFDKKLALKKETKCIYFLILDCYSDRDDCPFFEDVFDFSSKSSGASIDCSRLLVDNAADICINWGGGLHHAKREKASGFCYTNDIVLAIIELLKYYERVLYIDIDVHHGDGVEHAFYLTNRVFTLSFHKYGKEFFPWSGSMNDCGIEDGQYHTLNVPLKKGMSDVNYVNLFKSVSLGLISRLPLNWLIVIDLMLLSYRVVLIRLLVI
jgi:histone deacetylase HOS2